MPTPRDIIFFAPPAILEKPASAPRRMIIAPVPLARFPSSKEASCSTAPVRTRSATATRSRPMPMEAILVDPLASRDMPARAPIRITTAPVPLATPARSSAAIFSTAEARIRIAIANGISPIAPFINDPALLDRTLDTPVSDPRSTTTPVRPLAKPSASSAANFSTAEARILIAIAKAISAPAARPI